VVVVVVVNAGMPVVYETPLQVLPMLQMGIQ